MDGDLFIQLHAAVNEILRVQKISFVHYSFFIARDRVLHLST